MAKDDERARSGEAAAPEGAEQTPKGGEGAQRPRVMQEIRHGIPGKGFDAGTGYGGAGGDSAYSGESTYGGQGGYGGSSTRGAYAGGKYGRPDDPDGPFAGRGLDAHPPEPEDLEGQSAPPSEGDRERPAEG